LQREEAGMNQNAKRVRAEILEAAERQGVDLRRPENVFILGKKTPRFIEPWLTYAYQQMGTALLRGGYLAWIGNTDVFVLDNARGVVVGFDSSGNPGFVK
jgi:hypothetical protein